MRVAESARGHAGICRCALASPRCEVGDSSAGRGTDRGTGERRSGGMDVADGAKPMTSDMMLRPGFEWYFRSQRCLVKSWPTWGLSLHRLEPNSVRVDAEEPARPVS